MIDLFAKLNIVDYERVNAVDGKLVDYEKVLNNKMKVCERWLDPLEDRPLTPGEVGCILSHITVWSKIVTSGQPAIVLEDDLYHSSDKYNIAQISERLDEFDLVYLSKYNMDKNAQGFDDVFEIPGYCYWTSAYALSVEGAGRLLHKAAVQNLIPADEYLPMMLGTSPLAKDYPEFNELPKLRGLAYKENVFGQHSRNTEIGKTDTENNLRFKDYKDFKLLGGDGFYAANCPIYLEPSIKQHFKKKYKLNLSKKDCPNAIMLQKRIVQFKTNYRNLKELDRNLLALRNLIKKYDKFYLKKISN